MTEISDEFMQSMLTKTKSYTIVLLKNGPNRNIEGAGKIVWEHVRNNFRLRQEGLLPIVCPITDESDIPGVGIFNAGLQKVIEIMDEDPAVKAGIFKYEIHSCKSFPGDSLPD